MTKIQVVYASRHGGTAGIAEYIAEKLSAAGLDAKLADASTKPSPDGFDAYVIGSAVYLGRWLDDGINFIQRNQAMLATKPVWLFSSGPVGVVKSGPNGDPLEQALGPADGPGSGGRKRITGLAVLIQPRDHHVFAGVYDPTDPPKSMQERFVRMLPAGKATLPSADFRDWVDITKWSRSIAAQLSPVEVH